MTPAPQGPDRQKVREAIERLRGQVAYAVELDDDYMGDSTIRRADIEALLSLAAPDGADAGRVARLKLSQALCVIHDEHFALYSEIAVAVGKSPLDGWVIVADALLSRPSDARGREVTEAQLRDAWDQVRSGHDLPWDQLPLSQAQTLTDFAARLAASPRSEPPGA